MVKNCHKSITRLPLLCDSETIRVAADLCHPALCITADTKNIDVFAIFERDTSIQILPVLDDNKIIGLINKERFMGQMAGRFHWEVYSKKRCTKMMDDKPIVVEASMPIREVANLLLGSGIKNALSESFIIERSGKILGTGFTSDVLATLLAYEQEAAEELRQHRDHLSEMVEERTRDLMLAKVAAEKANQAKSEFLTNMSHELRTPLHAMLAFSGFGIQKINAGSREKLGQYFLHIKESAERLTHLVNDLLDLSKLEAGKITLNPVITNLGDLVLQVISEFDALSAQKNIEMHHHFDSELALISCDIERIHQVLTNIIGNAIKFSPASTRVSICLITLIKETSNSPMDQRIELRIIDQGPGIPDAELDTIFDRFIQSSKTRSGAGGTGLGLPISREIMRLHRGSISASNNPDRGACFSIKF